VDWGVVAENDVLTRVYNRVKGTPQQFDPKLITPDNAFNIEHAAPHDTALARRLCAEKLQQPSVRRNKDANFAHGAIFRANGV
jgi:hypothetical protein